MGLLYSTAGQVANDISRIYVSIQLRSFSNN